MIPAYVKKIGCKINEMIHDIKFHI
jgi:hypothetical protein